MIHERIYTSEYLRDWYWIQSFLTSFQLTLFLIVYEIDIKTYAGDNNIYKEDENTGDFTVSLRDWALGNNSTKFEFFLMFPNFLRS